MKDKFKKKLVVFLCIVLIFTSIFPKKAEAVAPIVVIGAAAAIGWAISYVLPKLEWEDKIVAGLAKLLTFLLSFIFRVVHYILWFFNLYVLTPIVNMFGELSPFEEVDNRLSPAVIMWNIFKNFAYILLSFSALFAGFQWLFNKDDVAKKLIFNIIIVAFIINFSFTLTKQLFLVVRQLEVGLTGGNTGKIGSIITASMWPADPFGAIGEALKGVSQPVDQNIPSIVYDSLIDVFKYFMVIVFDMINFIVLIMAAFLFLGRYICIIFYAATSSLATATLAIPETQKGPMVSVAQEIRQFDKWLDGFVRWLLVVPIFTIGVILGNIIKAEIFQEYSIFKQQGSAITGDTLMEFAIVMIFMVAWYLIIINFAVKLSGKAGKLAKSLAFATLAVAGMAALGPAIGALAGRVGGLLAKSGERIRDWGISRKSGLGRRIGDWAAKRIGQPLVERGQKIMGDVYKGQASISKERLLRISDELRRTPPTDTKKIENLKNQFISEISKYRNNPYMAGQLAETFEQLPSDVKNKLMRDPNIFKALSGISQFEGSILKSISGLDAESLGQIFTNVEIANQYLQDPKRTQALLDRAKQFNQGDALKMISHLRQVKPDIKDKNKEFFDNISKIINEKTNKFYGALGTGRPESIGAALAGFDPSFVSQALEIAEQNGVNTAQALVSLFQSASQEHARNVINQARANPDSKLYKAIQGLSEEDANRIRNNLRNDQLRDLFNSINSQSTIIIATK